MSEENNRYVKMFNDWELQELLGRGSDGAVYKISKSVGGLYDEAAVKIITVCQYNGKKEDLSKSYCLAIEKEIEENRQKALKEAHLMQKLRNNTHIVNLYDCDVQEWQEENRFGADLLLRIELLHNLAKDQREGKVFSEQDIIRVGKDICNALIFCHSREIVHRDIKPENIFRNDYGCYKLGDFGVSRIMDITRDTDATVGCGTKPYMAPEQYAQERYDLRVDIYGLGLVLYELANDNRLPFAKGPRARETDVVERLMGRKIPMPSKVSERLGKVILKACAYKPEERYQSAEKFYHALNELDLYDVDNRECVTSMVLDTNRVSETYEVKPDSKKNIKHIRHNEERDLYATRPADMEMQAEEYIRHLIKCTQQRDMMSQNKLAWCYKEGDGIQKNPKACARWLWRAAEQGYGPAQYWLGYCYMKGYGVSRDVSKGAEWWWLAAKGGNVEAMYDLARCYTTGIGVEQNYLNGMKWLQAAARQGHASALYGIGNYYWNGYGGPMDKCKAVEYFRKSAEQGCKEAQNSLGLCYYTGKGTEINEREAIKWFRRAAAQEYHWGYYNLGLCYETGFGVEIDILEAKEWYQRAADLGNGDATERLKRIQ